MTASSWAGPDSALGKYIEEESGKTLEAYRVKPDLVRRDANEETGLARGGYARRQVLELVQNAADAIRRNKSSGSIELHLTSKYLYCADNGTSIDESGALALTLSHLSTKHGTSEIGRFGLGFKSVLGVTDAPEFFSRSGSFRFDRDTARRKIQGIVPNFSHYPALTLAFPVNHVLEVGQDPTLNTISSWASNIVRLPLNEGSFVILEEQIRDFPAEFLLFVDNVDRLILWNHVLQKKRIITVIRNGKKCLIEDGLAKKSWELFKCVHRLSPEAIAGAGSADSIDEVTLQWAAPPNSLTRDPGKFWAFFPTMTSSLVAGILNAPWNTNADRQNLLWDVYNKELVDAAAALVARSLPVLATNDDPARHLDALPRRHEAGDTDHSGWLRDRLLYRLRDRNIVPDQNGMLQPAANLNYPPDGVGEVALARWTAYPGRPSDWLHPSAVTRTRLAAIDRLFPRQATVGRSYIESGAPRAAIGDWLEALKSGDVVEASKATIQAAAAIPPDNRRNNARLGKIVLAANGVWRTPDPESIFLPDPDTADTSVSASTVHPALSADDETRDALEELGIVQASPESRLRQLANELLEYGPDENRLEAFWASARGVDTADAWEIVRRTLRKQSWEAIRVRVLSGEWRPLHTVLLPGAIVPGDGSRDDSATLDIEFHKADLDLLRKIDPTGPSDEPEWCDLSREPWFNGFITRCRKDFCARPLSKNPQKNSLNFESTTGNGPLQLMEVLSDEGRVLYTDALLALDDTYESWTMRHDTQTIYEPLEFPSPAIDMLEKHGRIQTLDGIVPFRSALGEQPENRAAWRALLEHPKADRIREAFDLADLTPDSFGEPDVTDEEEPVPLLDEWPGLGDHLPDERKNDRLIRCDRIRAGGMDWPCFPYGSNIYLVRAAEEGRALCLVAEALKLGLSEAEIELILRRETPGEIRARREAVKREGTDAARLLKAIGETALRSELPGSLLSILEEHEGRLTGLRVAEAAIATWHTDTLRHFRDYLGHLDPPRQWAGSNRAVAFVKALGFSVEWAGERGSKRAAFEEVDGPFALPELHEYQRKIVDRTRALFSKGRLTVGNRRGMISMPTGSGKTRVAVQAVVEAIQEGELEGGVLWVADRDELCEQAVEAWQQVWVARGVRRKRLRISRLWGNQPKPLETGERHVVVASVQTLFARFRNKPDDYAFLADFTLLVFDEAHRSIARTYTQVMQELGMGGRRRRPGEPFLIGLTATPYRGHNERETAWLASRYGDMRLDRGAFASDDPHEVVAELQEMRVLAEADQMEIYGGALSLSDEELGQMAVSPWLPESAEHRIARDSERTMRIIEAFETHIEPDWPTLIFATSVEHAQTLAALLSGRGITARAVSGSTESSARRRIVEEFRNGDIQALVNYGVFREGFDAPRTRAIIVARPVYSPNLYFQMIGRGLRGRLNGGNDRCLILNVRDNILNYDRQLAFSDLDWLWGESRQARAA